MVVEALPRLSLISGPARSGKSRWAEHLAISSGMEVVYVATGPLRADDREWQERLRLHRQRRPNHWLLREVGADLVPALQALQVQQLALVDSLGTWVASLLEQDSVQWQASVEGLLDTVRCGQGTLVVVGEECGWGVVPPTAIGGLFRDRLGELQQRLAPLAGAAWLVLQGRALDLHRHALPVPEL